MNDWIDYTIHPVTGFQLPAHEVYANNHRLQVQRLMDKHNRDWVEDFYVSPKERYDFYSKGLYRAIFGEEYQVSSETIQTQE